MTEQQFNEITAWQKETFAKATSESKCWHLLEEVKELICEIVRGDNDKSKRLEFADCFTLLFGAAAADGMTYQDCINAIQDKFEINKKRTWGEPDANGVVNHTPPLYQASEQGEDGLKFGDYVTIEMKRHVGKNEFYSHKVVTTTRSNAWVDVPVQSPATITLHDKMEDVVWCICEGICEDMVLRYRVSDVKKQNRQTVRQGEEGWVKLEDGLPEDGDKYWINIKHPELGDTVCEAFIKDGEWRDNSMWRFVFPVSHYMKYKRPSPPNTY